eukprot:TRINITY_DN41855_c0_g1_i1.p2 TRINITY_DN41855_c0_g1~~TRINITY_DN41855_c0_g1_i1.p2  ORF type:complete len:163 (+),score=23.66 TRINITY_DN41855_c0_g1_i1:2-490(+)
MTQKKKKKKKIFLQKATSEKYLDSFAQKLAFRKLNRYFDSKIKLQIHHITLRHIDMHTMHDIRNNFSEITKIDLRPPFERKNQVQQGDNNNYEDLLLQNVLEQLQQFEKLKCVFLPKDAIARSLFSRGRSGSKIELKGDFKNNVIIEEVLRIWMQHHKKRTI